MHTSKQKITDKHNKYYTKALPGKTSSIPNHQNSEDINIEQLLQALASQLSNHHNQVDQLKIWRQIIERLEDFPHQSRILTAIVEPSNLSIKYANRAFCQLMGMNQIDEIESKQSHT
ncbi:MAG: hypothetical protein F6K34_09445, partial [Okeania sp. SIO4D6]|nr:hypothetical protein [Okeania sp. SIO4D6]